MKKITLFLSIILTASMISSCNKLKKSEAKEDSANDTPAYTVIENEQVDLATFPIDERWIYHYFQRNRFYRMARIRQRPCSGQMDY